ncbi:neurofibromin [Anaeramoeba flamelloides]|uniref:Neurofibromin n=1 Tax=Anaeramoeba flamelloides TaxID=1746091 RepID=A0AAV7Y8V1_9EUKA|nr:neurofibromin [Anaeramoeba flamelloides]
MNNLNFTENNETFTFKIDLGSANKRENYPRTPQPRVKKIKPVLPVVQNGILSVTPKFTRVGSKNSLKPKNTKYRTKQIKDGIGALKRCSQESKSFKKVIWLLNTTPNQTEESQSSVSSFGSESDLMQTIDKSMLSKIREPLTRYEIQDRSYRFLRTLSLKQRAKIISSCVQRTEQMGLMAGYQPIGIRTNEWVWKTDLKELLKRALKRKSLSHFDPLFCRNVLAEIVKTIPKDRMLPVDFLTNVLLENDRTTFEEFKKYIKNKNILQIWESLMRYWKHCRSARIYETIELSSIFGKMITNSTVSEFEKLNLNAQTSVKENLLKSNIKEEKDLESKIKPEKKRKNFEGKVLLSTEKKLRQHYINEKIKNQLMSLGSDKNKNIKNNNKSKSKSNKNKRFNEISINDFSSTNLSENSENDNNIWSKCHLVLTNKKIIFYNEKKTEKLGSLLLKKLMVYQKSSSLNQSYTSRIGGKDKKTNENENNHKRSSSINGKQSPNKAKGTITENQNNNEKKNFSISNTEQEKTFLIGENSLFNAVLVKVQNKEEAIKWISQILMRKRANIHDLHYISKKLSLKDPNNIILHNLLVSKNLSLVSAIIENFDTRIHQGNFESGEAIARSLVIAFYSKNRVMRILRWMIYNETTNGKNHAKTLFRSSSLSAKIIPVFVNLIGKEFLKSTLSSTIAMVSKIKSHLEVDPHRVGEEAAEKNKNALMLLTNEFIGKIILSTRETPLSFRIICRAMKKATHRVFPESTYKSLNNILFLRFFVPAIATPEAYGIMEKKDIDITLRRNLVSISKIIQNVGNQSKGMMGTLSCLDTFVNQSGTKIINYFKKMAQVPKNIDERNLLNKIEISNEEINEALQLLRNHISNNWQDLRDVLLNSDCRSNYTVFVTDFIENLLEN